MSDSDEQQPSARAVLLTILGEFVQPSGRPAWTSSILAVMSALGIEERAARQAIARSSAAGWIEGVRCGRQVQWHLTTVGAEVLRSGSERLASLSHPATVWDGQWFVVLVNIPHAQRAARRKLYGGLTWAGLGNPATGTWVSPHRERQAEVGNLLTALGLQSSTLSFVGRVGDLGMSDRDLVERGWDLAGLRVRYETLLDRLDALSPQPGWERMIEHVKLVTDWQRLPRLDPQLPVELLPGWIGRRVAERIEEITPLWAANARASWDRLNDIN